MRNWEAVPTASAIGQTAEGVAGDLQKLKASAFACYKLNAANNFVNLAEEHPLGLWWDQSKDDTFI